MLESKLLTPFQAYDPAKAQLFLMGQKVTGYAPDTKITVARNEDNITPHNGVDGEVSLAIIRNNTGVITVSLQNTSKWNGYLAAWQKQASLTGVAAFPVLLEVGGDGGLSLATVGWIQKQPDYQLSAEVGDMDWEIGVLDSWLSPSETASILGGTASLFGIGG